MLFMQAHKIRKKKVLFVCFMILLGNYFSGAEFCYLIKCIVFLIFFKVEGFFKHYIIANATLPLLSCSLLYAFCRIYFDVFILYKHGEFVVFFID